MISSFKFKFRVHRVPGPVTESLATCHPVKPERPEPELRFDSELKTSLTCPGSEPATAPSPLRLAREAARLRVRHCGPGGSPGQ